MAETMDSDQMQGMDAVRVQKMVFQARHGCSPAEREVGATFTVDVDLFFDCSAAGLSDDLGDTADVAEVYDIVQEVVTGTVRNLVETVAEDISQALLQRLDIVEAVRVVLHKDRGPMAGPSAGYEVEIFRW